MLEPDAAWGAELGEALGATYDTDAHFTAYAPVAIGDITVRLASDALGNADALAAAGGAFRMTALIGDVDDAVAHSTKEAARPEWRAETLAKIQAAGFAHYETRGGYRVLATLPGEFEIRTRDDAAKWRELYLGWCAYVRGEFNLELDTSCADWTRMYRLPNVMRDGQPQRAAVIGTMPAWDETQWRQPPDVPRAPARTLAPLATLPPADAGIAAALGDWRAYPGHKLAICGAIGGVMRHMAYSAAQCEAVIRAWLPANEPTVDVANGVTWALGAWAKPTEKVTGHGALVDLFGARHADVIERACWAASFAGRVAAARPPTPLVAATPWATPVVGGTAAADTPRGPAGKNFAALADFVRNRAAVAYDLRSLAVVRQTDGRRWTDADTGQLRLELSAANVEARKENIADAIELVAHENEFDPVARYLDSLPAWDGTARSAFVEFFGATPGVWADACWRVFSVSAVARALDPGCKVDTMIILEGDQGAGKSSGLRALTGAGFFSDTILVLDSPKQAIEGLMGVWVHEVAELSGLRGRDAERIKASLSSPEDRARLAYGRFTETVPRRSIFVATRNPDGSQWLTDTTGNRRYLPLLVGRVDVQAIAHHRDQLWAEALHRYRAGEPWWLQGNESPLHAYETEVRTETDPWLADVHTWLAKHPDNDVTISALFDPFNGAVPTPAEKKTPAMANRMARVLKRLGLRRHQVRNGGSREGVYVRSLALLNPQADRVTSPVTSKIVPMFSKSQGSHAVTSKTSKVT
ncbi:MAG TPA: virulence-associated E family protein [Polyangiaceae bacterium]|nr:virulence-associated E family protein [Polyangiaceae bacterium]